MHGQAHGASTPLPTPPPLLLLLLLPDSAPSSPLPMLPPPPAWLAGSVEIATQPEVGVVAFVTKIFDCQPAAPPLFSTAMTYVIAPINGANPLDGAAPDGTCTTSVLYALNPGASAACSAHEYVVWYESWYNQNSANTMPSMKHCEMKHTTQT